jgi:uncharacterized repeat protein (TIGR01451 family)
MTNWLRTLLIGGAAAAVVAVGAYFAAPYVRQMLGGTTTTALTGPFTKAAYDANGTPIVGPVHPGDAIQYVLSYAPPASGTSGPATITDTLSANQSYVAGSIQAPGWTWNPSLPYSVGNQTTYSNPGITPSGFLMNVPPPSGSTGTLASPAGDGFTPVPVSAVGHVYSIWHHKPNSALDHTGIMCWKLADFSPCSAAFPINGILGVDATPIWPRAVVVGSKIYFPAGQLSGLTVMEIGVGCWDASSDTSCPFFPVGASVPWNSSMSGSLFSAYIAGLAVDPVTPTHLFLSGNNHIYCVDVSASPTLCLGWSSPPLTGITPIQGLNDLIAGEGSSASQMFVEYNGNTSSPHVACRVMSTGANCPSWSVSSGSAEAIPAALPPPTSVTVINSYGTHPYTANYQILSPMPDTSGSNVVAICDHQALVGAPSCIDTSNGQAHTMPPIFSTLVTLGGPFNGDDDGYNPFSGDAPNGHARQTIAAFHIPGTAQVLYPGYITVNRPFCFDFQTMAACSSFSPDWSSDSTSSASNTTMLRDYGYAVDPTDPAHCLLGLGHAEVVWRFDHNGKTVGGDCNHTAQQPTAQTFHIDMDQYCFNKPQHVTWTNVEIIGRPSALNGGTFVIKDGSGNVLETINVSPTPLTGGEIYPLSIPPVSASGAVTVEFTPSYNGNPPPTAAYQIKLDYVADVNPQICYRVTIKDCTDGVAQADITNKAVYTDPVATHEADVNVGKPLGGKCGPQPCLVLHSALAANGDGTGTLALTGSGPPGFTAKNVTVLSLTPGVTVLPPASHNFPGGNINGTWNLSGLAPGQTITLEATATQPGAGDKGADKCCTSIIILTVPQSTKVDIGIQKTAKKIEPTAVQPGGWQFTVQVTNIGSAITAPAGIVVTDLVPAGLSFTSASGTDWNCGSTFPINSGGTLSCTYTGTAQIAAGAPLPPITIIASELGIPWTQNCASVAFNRETKYSDGNSENNKSCVTGGQQQGQTGGVKVTKKVSSDGIDTSALTFHANLACQPGATTALSLNQMDEYEQTISGLPAGSVCSVTESPPPVPTATKGRDCQWSTTYPNGTQTTVQFAATSMLQILNTLTCGEQNKCDPRSANAESGKCICLYPGMTLNRNETSCSCPNGEALQPGKGCVPPQTLCTGDAHWNGHKCAVCNDGRVWDEHKSTCATSLVCETQSTLPSNGKCLCRYGHMLRDDETSCACPIGSVLVPGLGCEVQQHAACDEASTRADGGKCMCRYDGMTQDAPNHCMCPQGTTLQEGQGCKISCPNSSMTRNTKGECQCPKDQRLKNGVCVKKRSLFGKILDNVHVGVGVGGSTSSPGKTKTQDPRPQQNGVDGR